MALGIFALTGRLSSWVSRCGNAFFPSPGASQMQLSPYSVAPRSSCSSLCHLLLRSIFDFYTPFVWWNFFLIQHSQHQNNSISYTRCTASLVKRTKCTHKLLQTFNTVCTLSVFLCTYILLFRQQLCRKCVRVLWLSLCTIEVQQNLACWWEM